MSGKQSTQQQQQQDVIGASSTEATGLQPYQRQFGLGYNNLNSAYSKMQATPYTPQNSSTFSPLVNYGVSAGIAANNAKQDSVNRGLAMNLNRAGTGNNSALLSALQARSAYSTAGANNALIPQAMQSQMQYDQLQNAQNLAARQQQGAELGQQQNLLQLLNQMAGMSGGQRQINYGTQTNQGTGVGKKSFF